MSDPHDDHDPFDDYERCWTCKGRGVLNPLTAPLDFFCVGTTTCPDCYGTGEESR